VFKVVFVRRSCTIFHCQGKKLSAVDGEEAVVSTEKLARGMTNDLILHVLSGPSLGVCRMGDDAGPLILIGLQVYSTTHIAKPSR
jgi:hypothetical protein